MSAQTSNAQPLQPRLLITAAFTRFEEVVSDEDQKEFSRTTVQNVIDAIAIIEVSLRQKRENRNTRSLYPLLKGLEKYSGIIESLSNGLSPYMPWAWAPIKLILQVASEHLSAFDKLLEAYSRIRETLPRFEKLGGAFQDNPNLLAKLALYYTEIINFQREAYKMVRRKSWYFFFMTTWGRFDLRFDAIVTSLARHSEMIDQEATTIDIVEAKRWRKDLELKVAKQEEDRKSQHRLSVVSWLNMPAQPQHDQLERLLRDCLLGSCDWIHTHPHIEAWCQADAKLPVIWLQGKPGAGKSVICARLIDHLGDSGLPTIFYFCQYQKTDNSSSILKSLVLQLIERDPSIAAFAYTDYVAQNQSPSLKVLRSMLVGSKEKAGLLGWTSPCRIVIDGLDECQESEQSTIIEDLLHLVSASSTSSNCKLLICSRNVTEISRTLQRRAKHCARISLTDEQHGVNTAIRSFVQAKLCDMEHSSSLDIDADMKDTISQIMTDRANGMFLWVKLVLTSLEDVDSKKELRKTISEMPKELPQLYGRILDKLLAPRGGNASEKLIGILAWLAFARRPLRRHEIVHGAAITPESPSPTSGDVLHPDAVDKCRPFVEELPNGAVTLVHFTAQEYLVGEYFASRMGLATWDSRISFACAVTIKDGLDLLDPDIHEHKKLLEVLNGSYALLTYSISFWVDHLLAYAAKTHLDASSPIAMALTEVDALHQRLTRKVKQETSDRPQIDIADSHVQRIAHLRGASLCAAVLAFRQHCKKQPADTGAESRKKSVEQDPTLLTRLSATFDNLVKQLLDGNVDLVGAGIATEKLDLFRKQYSKCSYRCRYPACTAALSGFASESERASHEQQHVQRLFCDRPGCYTGRLGFSTQSTLRKHNKTYHEEGSLLIPATIRRAALRPSADAENAGAKELNNQDGTSESASEVVRKISRRLGSPALGSDFLSSLRAETGSPTPGKVDKDTMVVFNSDINPRILDVNPVRTIQQDGIIHAVSYTPDGKAIALALLKETRIIDAKTGERLPQIYSGGNWLHSIHFSPDGKFLVVPKGRESIEVWNVAERKTHSILREGPVKNITCIDLSKDGTTVALGSDASVWLWGVLHKKAPAQFGFQTAITAVTLSPDNKYVAAGSLWGSVRIWDVGSGTVLLDWKEPEWITGISGLRFSPDSKQLVCSNSESRVAVWTLSSMTTGAPPSRRSLDGHMKRVSCIAVTPDQRYIISASEDHTIQFWDFTKHVPSLMLVGHQDMIYHIAVSPNGRSFATAGRDMRLRIWSYGYLDGS